MNIHDVYFNGALKQREPDTTSFQLVRLLSALPILGSLNFMLWWPFWFQVVVR